MTHVLFLCTGNAARSVMGGAVLTALRPDLIVTTAGTHVIDGQPMSWRTREALESVGYANPAHRSQQLRAADRHDADLIIALAAEHVGWMRRVHPEDAAKTGTLRRLARDLSLDTTHPLSERVAALGLADLEVEHWEDVDDPAGHEIDTYKTCAADIAQLVTELAPRF